MREAWRIVALGDICNAQRGITYVSDQLDPPGVPFVTIKCIGRNGGFRANGIKTFSGRIADHEKLRAGDLVVANTDLTRDGSIIGSPALIPELSDDAAFSMDVSRLNVDRGKIDRGFLAYRLTLPDARNFMREISGGSTVVHLQVSQIGKFSFAIPSLNEQRRIAEILRSVELQIDITDKLIEKLRSRMVGVSEALLAAVTNPIVRLSEFLLERPKNGFSPKEVDSWTALRALGLGCLTTAGFSPRQLKYVPPDDPRNSAALLTDGDLLMSRANTRDLVGLAGVYHDIGVPCIYSDLMMRLRPTSKCLPEFLELVLLGSQVRRQVQAVAQGTSESMVKITGAAVSSLRVAIPDLAEQQSILGYLSAVRRQIEVQEHELAKLDKLKLGLLNDMLVGAA
jgi:restriction endonuclease S subunit